jgi:crotonobetainyl-CoA:carnitine CoA-transferase CaiB-like acyl-CoA transferase
MTAVMQGVRILEVAEHTFVPAAAALLADWGAEVIKIEHVERGDAMRALASTGVTTIPTDVHVLLEHANRGKRSLALDLTSDEGLDILYRLASTADVFLTNKLPSVRTKLRIDVDDIRAHNERIVYVRGTGQGERGPEADKGSYDSLSFWARSGVAFGVMRKEYGHVPVMPSPGFGDSLGGMTIAGGIMGALFHRERTGEGADVDVSLLSTGMWAMGNAIALALLLDRSWSPPPAHAISVNPLMGYYQTKDERWLCFSCLQGGKYWPPLCDVIGRPELATDPRFADHTSLLANHLDAIGILREVFVERPLDEWRAKLDDFVGQWSVVQDAREMAADPQAIANGYLQECETADGKPFRLVAAPVQFDGAPAAPGRAPEFNEHCDEILGELGLDWDTVMDLKVRGVVG